ncbi:MAG: hypothetical protein WC815_20070 [Vicinamibacterales bacterium]|jgi:hypothetical protein
MTRFTLAVVLTLSLAACGGGSTTPTSAASPTVSATPTPAPAPAACTGITSFAMSATVDGAGWCANAVRRATYIPSNGYIQVGASDSTDQSVTDIVFMLKTGGRPGTYTVDDRAAELSALVTRKVGAAGLQSTWAVNYPMNVQGILSGGTGTVTITAISATGASGTFSLSAVPLTPGGGTTGTKAVTNGAFNVTF